MVSGTAFTSRGQPQLSSTIWSRWRGGDGTEGYRIARRRKSGQSKQVSAIVRAMQRRGQAPANRQLTPQIPITHSAGDRRRFPRQGGTCTVSVLRCDGSPRSILNPDWAFRASPLQGQMLDVSIGGVAFLVSEPVDIDAVLVVEIRHAHRDVGVVRHVSVIECQPHGEDRWKIFCQFLQRLSFDEVTLLRHVPTV